MFLLYSGSESLVSCPGGALPPGVLRLQVGATILTPLYFSNPQFQLIFKTYQQERSEHGELHSVAGILFVGPQKWALGVQLDTGFVTESGCLWQVHWVELWLQDGGQHQGLSKLQIQSPLVEHFPQCNCCYLFLFLSTNTAMRPRKLTYFPEY